MCANGSKSHNKIIQKSESKKRFRLLATLVQAKSSHYAKTQIEVAKKGKHSTTED
jgi:hypothetical protein